MRVVYLGLPLGALSLQSAGIRPVASLIGHPDAPGMARLRRTHPGLLLGRPDLSDPGVERLLESLRPDLLMSWFWPFLVPEPVLALAPAYGVHPSLLPRHRGRDPIFWTLRAGDRQAGVTLHRLDANFDTGAIAAQIALPIRNEPTAGELARQLDRPSLWLFTLAARHLVNGGTFLKRNQDESKATEAPKPSDQDLSIDWNESTASILRLIRAALPDPRASAKLGDHLVEVISACAAGPILALEPGQALRTTEGPRVRTADGSVLLRAVLANSILRGKAINQLVPTTGPKASE